MIREDNCLCEDDPCKAIIRDCGSKCNACDFSGTLEIFKEFNEVYKERLKKAEEACGDISQLKIKTLEDWVADLTEQNTVLVETVEALEREALYRLELGINAQKCSELEKGASEYGMLVVHKENRMLKEKIGRLVNDLSSLLELIKRLRIDGYWYLDNLQFFEICYEDIFGQSPPSYAPGISRQSCSSSVSHSVDSGNVCVGVPSSLVAIGPHIYIDHQLLQGKDSSSHNQENKNKLSKSVKNQNKKEQGYSSSFECYSSIKN